MDVARAFFTPLSAHLHTTIKELDDKDLAAAHRVFAAMIAAMSTFEDELRVDRSKSSTH